MSKAVGSLAPRLAAAAVFAVLVSHGAAAAERRLLTTEGADYFGLDYDVRRDVEREACESACLADERCEAFTYNTSARWCFLKSGVGELRSVDGAVSGRVVLSEAPRVDVRAERTAEFAFLPGRYLDEARRLEGRLSERYSGPPSRVAEVLAEAVDAEAGSDFARALELYRAAAGMAPERFDLWRSLAATSFLVPAGRGEAAAERAAERTATAVAAYLRAESEDERAALLALIARSLEAREAWRPALAAYRASLALRPNATVEDSYKSLFGRHGFRIVDHTIDAETASPRICVLFSEPLGTDVGEASAFVSVGPDGNYAVEADGRQLCVDGVDHGRRYSVAVRSGLPSAEGESLPRSVSLDIFVPDRAPSVRFLGNAYVLPAGGEASIPLVSVNAEVIEAEVLRIGDRQLADAIGDGTFLSQLYQYQRQEIAERTGESVWKGTVEVARSLNREVTTAVPVSDMVPELKPGAYLMSARAANEKDNWGPSATQWFVVSDLGLSSLSAHDGLHVFVRSLGSARPVPGVELRLVAANNEILGRAESDADGYARFAGGLIRGTGGGAPALIAAEGPAGDYNMLDLTRPALDLTDRGVEGRAPPGPLDVFLTTERGIYRAGEPVHVTALVRDARANAVADAPLTAIITRPDGVEQTRFGLADEALGGAYTRLDLPANAMRGAWRIGVHADPQASPLAEATFLVEDFQPERLDFELTTDADVIDPSAPPAIALAARFLYGQPASGLSVEGEVVVRPAESLGAYPGYRFGLEGDSFETLREPLTAAETDDQGAAALTLALPRLPASSRPLEAEVNVRVVDPGGQPVERNLALPVAAERPRVGVRPLFDSAVEENSEVAFQVIALGADGQRLALGELSWTLARIDRRFQWYQTDGRWDYEATESRSRVADGTVPVSADEPARVTVRPEWGVYELEVRDATGRALPASLRFEAGWYVEAKAADTPEALRLSLDKPRYRVGETARVRIESREPGVAQLMVLDDRLVDARTVEVPEGGADVEVPVTRDWGPGAYVTAALYRPMDLEARRMPARALGLSWAAVDPGDRRLAVALNLPEAARPRQAFAVALDLENIAPGEEAYVTVAAVDAGILNLTRYEPPAPDEYYFGQRRLGTEIRDVYNQLIDRMQGARGRVRSGGDAPLARFEGPPPTDTVVALHSGIVRVDEDGTATAVFDMPDFNGTVRVMAMAWTREGVGHATADVLVRDPVVVSLSRPTFLAPGDSSRLLIDLAATEDAAGPATLTVSAGGGAVALADGTVTRDLEMAPGERREVRVPLEAVAAGDGAVDVALTLADGTRLEKRAVVAVRDNRPENVHSTFITLAPGDSLRLGPDILAGFLPQSATVDVSVSGAGRLNLPAIVGALDRFPYGCTEQIASRALPLVYLDEVTLAAGLRGDPAVRKRVEDAILGILANQSATGGFGLWGPGGDDLWLDAYVTDFLTRARRHGFAVPDAAFDRAIDNLRNRLSYVPDFDTGGEDIAYALYVLAANGRAAIGDLRYYAETKLDSFSTPLAKAQIGAALALYGDKEGADAVFRRAAFELRDEFDDRRWRADYGSRLRDAAAVLTLASEVRSDAVDLATLSDRVEAGRAAARYTSTQEDTWTLLAAHALIQRAATARLGVDGQALEGPLHRSFDAGAIANRPLIENRGTEPVEVAVAVTGISETPEPAGGNFYAIDRAYYTLEGEPADAAALEQGERLVTVLTVTSQEPRAARLAVNDPLPAGLEIDNPHLLRSGEVAALAWLDLPEETAHTEFRADRFVAALDRTDGDATRFQLAYIVRAVAPGRFAHPAAVVEDMYRPERRARTAAGNVEVYGPLR